MNTGKDMRLPFAALGFLTERFEHNQKFIKVNKLKGILTRVVKFKNLTQFEIAFGIFIKDLKLDWAIGEFGLFGRLDGIRSI